MLQTAVVDPSALFLALEACHLCKKGIQSFHPIPCGSRARDFLSYYAKS